MATPRDIITFAPWPKTPHWFRDITVTEKLDGTNAAIIIVPDGIGQESYGSAQFVTDGENAFWIGCQSRKRLLTPTDDNFGFAAWVWANARTLVDDLGPGRHFGEWWGQGIQRGYDMDHRRFSLFNTKKWGDEDFQTKGLDVVPVLYEGPLEDFDVEAQLDDLRQDGSYASEGFMDPEGIVIYHQHANQVFKIRLEDRPAETPEVASIYDLIPPMPTSKLFGLSNLFGSKAA